MSIFKPINVAAFAGVALVSAGLAHSISLYTSNYAYKALSEEGLPRNSVVSLEPNTLKCLRDNPERLKLLTRGYNFEYRDAGSVRKGHLCVYHGVSDVVHFEQPSFAL